MTLATRPSRTSGRTPSRTITLRRVRPDDAPAMQAFVESLSAASRRLRFHGAVNACAPGLLRHLTEADGVRHVAYVAVAALPTGGERIVGEARYVTDGGERAEFAISVDDLLQGQGLAEALMELLLATARSAGVARLHGDVLSTNVRMASFMRRLGFEQAWQFDADAGVDRWERATHPEARRLGEGLRLWLRGWSQARQSRGWSYARPAMPELQP